MSELKKPEKMERINNHLTPVETLTYNKAIEECDARITKEYEKRELTKE